MRKIDNEFSGKSSYMKSSAIKDFTEGNIAKQLILFSLPLFLSNLLQVVYNMVDMLVVGLALVCTKLVYNEH